MRASLAVLIPALFAPGCARELDLPAPPSPAAAEEAPIFLGPLSGYWTGSLIAEDDDGQSEFPLPLLLAIVDLEPPSGASAGPAIGIQLSGSDDLSFVGTFDGSTLRLATDEGELAVDRAPGGTALSFGPVHRICPEGPRRELRLQRLCGFDPALSGIYEGEERDCDGGAASPVRVALATADDMLVGMFWPETKWALVVGAFDPFATQLGGISAELDKVVASGDRDASAIHPTLVTLAEADDRLTLTLERYAPSDGACERRIVVHRPAGATPAKCSFAALQGERHMLEVRWLELPGGRLLGVDVLDALGRRLAPEDAVCLDASLQNFAGERANVLEVPAELPTPGAPELLQPRPTFLLEVAPLGPGEELSLELLVAQRCDRGLRLPIQPRCLTLSGDQLDAG